MESVPSGERISKLSAHVADSMRSLQTIVTASQAIEELVLNSLDAKATRIDISIDFARFHFSVSDNGHGFPLDQLPLIGSAHATSKCVGLDDLSTRESGATYGFRGEALSSLGHVALLEIHSCCLKTPVSGDPHDTVTCRKKVCFYVLCKI
jgi:DNA mismatch repair ATPase MutL